METQPAGENPPSPDPERDPPPAPAGMPPLAEGPGTVPIQPIAWKPSQKADPADAQSVLSLPKPPPAAGHPRNPSRDYVPRANKTATKSPAKLAEPRRTGRKTQTRRNPEKRRIAVMVWLASLILCGGLFFALGLAAGTSRDRQAEPAAGSGLQDAPAEPEGTRSHVPASGDEEKSLNRAFALLRSGDGHGALQILRTLRSANPHLRSLSYASALAALQAGDIRTAMIEAENSLRLGERVSDVYALGAAAESLKPGSTEWQTFGDPAVRGESLLREAIAADQANAAPRLELGMRLRAQGQTAAAAEMLESARLRLHPVDPANVIDTTLLLMALEKTPDAALPPNLDPDKNPANLLGAAYVAMRRSDYAGALSMLEKARVRLTPELYDYLLADPAFAPYRDRPELGAAF